MQFRSGAYQSEFGRDSDEPAHYVTGLMVRDYVAAGFPGSPMQFASNYYAHYPKVALGHWPPLFYVVQAAWTLPFTPGRASVLLLLALITALTAQSLFFLLLEQYPFLVSAGVTLVFLTLPVVTSFTNATMSEMLLTLFVLRALISYWGYLEEPDWRPALAFGIWSSLAILTKGTGVELALIPPLACLLGRRWDLPRRLTFWLPALIVAAVAAPWYWLAPAAAHQSVAPYGGPGLYWARLWTTFSAWFDMLGAVPAAAAVLGLAATWRFGTRPEFVVPAATLLSAWMCRLTVGAWSERHLVTTVPILMMLAAAGAVWLWDRPLLRAAPSIARTAGFAAVLCLVAGWNIWHTQAKPRFGYAQAAEALLSQPALRDSAFLVCAGAQGEGMAVAEVAMRESRPGHYVLRASKQMAVSDWMGYTYESRFHSTAAVTAFLDEIPVSAVLLDPDGLATEHGRLLRDALQIQKGNWRLAGRYHGSGGELTVYQRIVPRPVSPNGVNIQPDARRISGGEAR